MEIEYFVNPGDIVDGRPADESWHERWIADCMDFFQRYGLRAENLRLREHEKESWPTTPSGRRMSSIAFPSDGAS